MTRLQLKEALAWEGKIQNDVDALAQLDSIILDAAIFIGQTHPELLLINEVVYDIASENPTPFVAALGIDKVELRGATGLTEPATIPNENGVVGPAPLPGWPKCYSIQGNANTSNANPKGLSITLMGGDSLDIGVDEFVVYYKQVPQLTSDTDIIPDSWIVALKKECLARLALRRAKSELDASKGYTAGFVQGVQAENATDNASVNN